MINLFISFLMIIFSFDFFAISYQLNGVNRAFTSLPISIFETCVVLDSTILYFNKNKLETQLTSYLDYTISKYTDNYNYNFLYLSSYDSSFNLDNMPDKIEISLNAKLAFSIDYSKTMSFVIWGN